MRVNVCDICEFVCVYVCISLFVYVCMYVCVYVCEINIFWESFHQKLDLQFTTASTSDPQPRLPDRRPGGSSI